MHVKVTNLKVLRIWGLIVCSSMAFSSLRLTFHKSDSPVLSDSLRACRLPSTNNTYCKKNDLLSSIHAHPLHDTHLCSSMAFSSLRLTFHKSDSPVLSDSLRACRLPSNGVRQYVGVNVGWCSRHTLHHTDHINYYFIIVHNALLAN